MISIPSNLKMCSFDSVWASHGLPGVGVDALVTKLSVQGGKITFVYIASLEEDGDDLETGVIIARDLLTAVSCVNL